MTSQGRAATALDRASRAAAADAADPLAAHRERFVPAPGVVAYLDGNSLGRPLGATVERMAGFVERDWGGRLIRGWSEGWMTEPVELGDRIGRVVLGAAAGQTVVADSTSVLLYKLMRAGLDLRPGRSGVVVDGADFPTDRFIAAGVAAETGRRVVPLADGLDAAERVRRTVDAGTALVVTSHVDYRTARMADLAALAGAAHDAGALLLVDLSHSAGVAPIDLDASGVDLAVGCTYKYLNGGPGSPAFAYVRRDLQDGLTQPIPGWMGAADVFAMADRHEPAPGIRRLLSGTPPIVAMQPVRDMLDLVEEAGLDAVRAKSVALTDAVLDYADAVLAPYGVRTGTPRVAGERGSHVTLEHPAFERIVPELWERGVVPDFRAPDGLRVGLSPLSTSFTELHAGLEAIRDALDAA
jgi:kynureninase